MGSRGRELPEDEEGVRCGSGAIGSAKRDATAADADAPSGSKVMSSSVSVPERDAASAPAMEPSSSSSKST